MTLFDAELSAPVPTAFVAFTLNVYAVPLVRPVTVIGDPLPVAVMLPGVDVTVYCVIALPPLLGALNETVACAFPAVAETLVGAPGTVGAAGQIVPLTARAIDDIDHMPLATDVVGLLTTPTTPPFAARPI